MTGRHSFSQRRSPPRRRSRRGRFAVGLALVAAVLLGSGPPSASVAVRPPATAPDAGALVERAVNLQAVGRWREALDAFAEAEAALQSSTDLPATQRHATLTLLATQMAVCHEQLGEVEQQLAAYERARQRLHDVTDAEFVRTIEPQLLADISECQRRLGDARRAVETAEAATAAARAGNVDPATLGVALFRLGLARLAVADNAAAIEALLASIDALPPGHGARPFVKQAYAASLMALGDYDEAIGVFGEVLDGQLEPQMQVLTLTNRAWAHLLSDAHDIAERDADQAAQIARRAGLDRADYGIRARSLLSFLLVKRGELDEGLALARAAMDDRIALEDGPSVLAVTEIAHYAHALRAKGRAADEPALLEHARTELERAIEIARATESTQLSYLLTLLADLLLDDAAARDEAVPLLEEAIQRIEVVRNEAERLADVGLQARWIALLRRYDPYLLLVRAEALRGRLERAVEVLETARGRDLLDLLSASGVETAARARDALDAQTRARLDAVTRDRDAARAELLTLQRRVELAPDDTALRSMLHERRARLAALSQERARLLGSATDVAAPLSISEIRAGLADDECMLYYALDDEGGFVFVVPPEGESIVAARLTAPDGRDLSLERARADVALWRDAVLADGKAAVERGGGVRRRSAVTSVASTTGHELFRTLVPADVWETVRGRSCVYVVPYGALHVLPFEALVVEPGVDAASATYWLDVGPTLCYVASGSVLTWSRERRREQNAGLPGTRVLVVADPGAGEGPASAERRRLAPLPGARLEGAAIRETFEPRPLEVTVLSGSDATETRVSDLAVDARFLHIATHQLPGRPGDPSGRLVLSPASTTPTDDGFIDLDDLLTRWRGRLDRCELVVLSACGSALGTQVAGEEILGLPWGFQSAGAPAVLASLWPVSDTVTSDLMSELYARLGSDDVDRLHHFTQAQRTIRAHRPEPYFWAPFVWNGAP